MDRAGRRIDLTATEFALLEYFMRHQGHVLSKAELLSHVWSWESEGTTNLVEVYVGNLRRKMDVPFQAESIETVRGVGYRLSASA